MISMGEREYSLSQLMNILQLWFEEIFSDFSFLCVAEVVWCVEKKSWYYIDCIEYDKDGQVKARCSLCCFAKHLMKDFFSNTWLNSNTIQWQKILFSGKTVLFGDRIQIHVSALHATYTLWQLHIAQKHIIATLQQEGILRHNKMTTIWEPPFHIAIISSATSDWLTDFYATLDAQHIAYQTTLYEAYVHSNQAKDSVYKSLQQIYTAIKSWKHYTAVCIIRGWGDMAWMLRQNDVDIARGICHMPIPVIVAVWHTKDDTVLDEVSYLVANTPTAAWQYFVDIILHYRNHIQRMNDDIDYVHRHAVTIYKDRINSLYESILVKSNHLYRMVYEKVMTLIEKIWLYHPHRILEKWYAIVREEDIFLKERIPLIWAYIEIETSSIIIHATVDSVATKE